MIRRTAYLLFVVCITLSALVAQNRPDRIVIRGGTLIDVRTGKLTPNGWIVLEGRTGTYHTGYASPSRLASGPGGRSKVHTFFIDRPQAA